MTEATTPEWKGPASSRQFLGHPVGLFVLFFTEMWERFSYYGMRGLLKLYMVNFLFVGIRQTLQGREYSGMGNPDDVLGWRFIKGLLPKVDPALIQSCISERAAALVAGDPVKHLAPVAADLAHTIASQTCAMEPNASVLYGWYTGFVYMTPVLGGLIADRYLGQKRSVYVGAVIMALGQFVLFGSESAFFIGLLLLIVGNGFFKPNISTQVGSLYPPGDSRRDGAFTIFYMGINLGSFICNFVCGTLALFYGWRWGFLAAGVGMCIGLAVQLLFGSSTLAPDTLQKREAGSAEAAKQPLTKNEWKRVGALVTIYLLIVVFWAVYEQQGNTMQTWADQKTIWPSWASSTWFQSVNPAFIFILAPLFDMFWRWQAKRGKEPSSVSKMAIGAFLLGGSFIFMVVGAKVIGTGKGSLLWPVFATLVLTVGELYLSPIGLSLVTKVAPVRIVSLMMGCFFIANFLGNVLCGYIGQLYTTMSADWFFLLLMALGTGVGLALWAFNKPINRAMASHGWDMPTPTGETTLLDPTRAPGTGPGSLPTYVPASESPREFTVRAVLLGSVLSVLFGMVNAYAGLKIGLTVSASIPSAILSMSVLRGILGRPPPRFLGSVGRWLFGRDTVLENNATHAVASTGESLAGGIIFTAPALIFLARDAQALGQPAEGPSKLLLFLLGLSGGLLGILMMIPLRRYLMIEEHERLPFPEGTACAKVLIAGDKGGASALPVLIGAGVGACYDALTDLSTAFRDTVTWTVKSLHQSTISFQLNPLMLGVGYLIGLESSAIMLWGGILGWVFLIPAFDWMMHAQVGLGASLAGVMSIPGVCAAADPCAKDAYYQLHALACQAPHTLAGAMAGGCSPDFGPDDVWSHYVRYVGAGGVAMGGFVSLTRSLPVMGRSFKAGLSGFKSAGKGTKERTDRDLPTWLTLVGAVVVGLALWLVPEFKLGWIEALLAVGFCFFFVVVSARMVGLIGTTSQPVSGMTIAALLCTSVILSHVRGPGMASMVAAMTVGVVVCIAVCLSGDLSQDLKTCTILGGTPWVVQTGQMIGTLSAALRAGWVLWILDARYHLGSAALPAPQATLMATLVQGTFGGHLPWALLITGAVVALIAEVIGWGGLTFSIGLYLPVATSASFIFGGLLQYWLKKRHPAESPEYKDADERATLLSSGMIAGYALMGIAVAFVGVAADQAAGHPALAVFKWVQDHAVLRTPGAAAFEDALTLAPFIGITALLAWFAGRRRPIPAATPPA